jgi:hypothetical protein
MSLLFRVILIGKSVILIDPTASVMQEVSVLAPDHVLAASVSEGSCCGFILFGTGFWPFSFGMSLQQSSFASSRDLS